MKLALLTNIIAPYRIPIYRRLSEEFDLLILYSGTEDNRDDWDKNLANEINARIKSSFGFTIKRKIKKDESVFDFNYTHINPGLLIDLFKFQPDRIITNELGFRTIVSLFYGYLMSIPVWVWWGGTLHTERSVGVLKKIIRKLLSKVINHWISYGETSTEYLLSIGAQRKDILQIQNCVDDQLFSEQVEPALSIKPKPVLLFVGQLIERKGLKHFLDVAESLQKEGYDFSILIVGNGLLNKYKDLANTLELENIDFLGSVDHKEMPSIYKSTDLLVFPTLEDVWGLVVNEAILAGIPVLSSIYAGCTKELVPKEMRFDPINKKNFFETLKSWLDNHNSKRSRAEPLMGIDIVSKLLINDLQKEFT